MSDDDRDLAAELLEMQRQRDHAWKLLDGIVSAYIVVGRSPQYHAAQQRHLRIKWPTLHLQLRRVLDTRHLRTKGH
jgi:hypothetical protein